MSNAIYHQTSAGFAATASAFVVESIGLIIPWLMVMGVLIFCDLVAGIAKAIRLKEKVRFSRAWRDTLAKTCTYFAWVVVACWVQVATGGDVNYSKGACMLVVIIEAASIVSNILKWHGYNLDFGMIVTYFVERLTHAAPHELDGVITKDEDEGAAKDGCDGNAGGRLSEGAANHGCDGNTGGRLSEGAAKDGCDGNAGGRDAERRRPRKRKDN